MSNILILIVRKAYKYKIYSLINLAGLSISFALSALVFLYAFNEFNVDGFHQNKNRIYRVVDSQKGCAFTQPLLAGELEEAFPEIETTTRVRHTDGGFYKYKDQSYEIQYAMCFDSTAFRMFDFQMVSGEANNAMQDPFSVILSETTAKKIFGTTNPIGQILNYNNVFNFTVTGIIRDLPENSTFTVDAVFPFPVVSYLWSGNPNKPSDVLKSRGNESFHTYIMFKENVDVNSVENKIAFFIKENSYGTGYQLQRLSDIYFDTNDRDRWINKGEAYMVFLLLSVAIGLLVISIINYINLSSAVNQDNLFNIGLRKLLGALPGHIFWLIFIETLLFFGVALLLAVVMVIFIYVPFQSVLYVDYSYAEIINIKTVIVFVSVIVLLAFISAIIPLQYLKHIPPSKIIRKNTFQTGSSGYLNKGLIVLQFVITIVFIASTITIRKQVAFINDKNMDYGEELLAYVDLRAFDLSESQSSLIQEKLIASPYIHHVSFSAGIFGDVRRGMTDEIDGVQVHYRRIPTDPDYLKTTGYKLVKGRDFSWEMSSDMETRAYIVNEALVRAFNLKDPLNVKLNNHPIVGVVKDFYFESIHKPIDPVALMCDPDDNKWVANINMHSSNLAKTIEYVEQVFKDVNPDCPFHLTFANDRIAGYYKKERQFSKLSMMFSTISILIACFGLVGLVLFRINRRIKEIGIRKVNGAKVFEILSLINKDFLYWVSIAFVLACPMSWYFMNKWLETYAYKTELSWWIFALTGVLTIIIAGLTVSWQSWKAATKNPVEALRYE